MFRCWNFEFSFSNSIVDSPRGDFLFLLIIHFSASRYDKQGVYIPHWKEEKRKEKKQGEKGETEQVKVKTKKKKG